MLGGFSDADIASLGFPDRYTTLKGLIRVAFGLSEYANEDISASEVATRLRLFANPTNNSGVLWPNNVENARNAGHDRGLWPNEVGNARNGGQGGGLKKMTTSWVSTGRKITLRDGSQRSLYKNAGKPGELRIRRMAMRAGQTVTTYIKPPSASMLRRG
jgi:hypothetical protein